MNVFDYFFENSKKLKKDFVLGSKETISYRFVYENSLKLAGYINKTIGENNNILLLGPNSVFLITAYLGILKSGNICVPLNPKIENDNLQYIIKKSKTPLSFVNNDLLNVYDLSGISIITETEFDNIINNTKIGNNDTDLNDFDDNRIAEIIFTSGSTGKPKGVMISHRNIIANTDSIIEYLELSESDIIEIVLPFYYCYGLSLLHTHLRVGGSVVLNNMFIFIGSVVNDLKKYKCTGFAGVPSHFQILLRKTKSFKTTDFPDLKYVTQAGGKLYDAFIKEFIDCFPRVKFFVMYGQTEATARLSYLPPELLPEKIGSIGKGIPDVELDVVNEKGNTVIPGEIGEIIAKGDNIMPGYLDDEESTNKTIINSWLHTGDLATKDKDGYIYLTARIKEIIKVGGNRISPKEIEEVIVTIPDVVDCTIDGVEDELLGESLKATIVVNNINDSKLTDKYIRNYCAEKLVSYKIPQIIEFRDKVSISATGKKVKA